MKTELFSNIKKKYKIGRIDSLAYLLIVIFILIFIFLSFGRHDALKSYLNDIGTYDQVIWNMLHGRFFQITTSMYNETNFLAGHFSLIFLFFVPFYAIWASPKWLLFFQALAVGLSAVPIYWLAKEKLKNYWVALVFLVSYLLNPFLHNGLLYDFHEVVLAAVFASWAFYFLEKRKNNLFIIFSILLAICQEHLVLIVFMMGLYAFFIQKRRKFGLVISAISIAYFLSVIAIVMPYFSHTGKPAILENNAQYGNRYAWLGASMPEIIKNIISHPLAILTVILSAERMKYLFYLVLPVFSLGLYSWPILIVFPLLLINLLSSNPMTYDIFFYHSAVLVPFVYFAAIITFKRWFLSDMSLRNFFTGLILISSIAVSIIFGVTPLSQKYKLSDYLSTDHSKRVDELKKIIPGGASLSVQHNLGPHFSERKEIYRFPLKKDEVQYIMLDQTDPYRNNPFQIFKFDYALQMEPDEWKNNIADLKNSSDYDIVYDQDGYLIFKRNK